MKIKIVTPVKGAYDVKEIDISTVIAAIFEPIIGEGGIREIKRDVLDHFHNYSFPLIMDEIQCGLGRSGRFLASEGIKADYYLLGKSLGGGIEKISAVLIDKNRYQVNFGKYYVSTYANGGLAARTALEVLSIIEKENLPEKIRRSGELFIKKLKNVQAKYPGVIKSISGRGLMIGVEFCSFANDALLFLRILQGKKMLGYLFAAYLLKNHKVRILPTISASNTLRIEPSAYISKREIDHFIEALQDLAATIQKRQSYELVLSLMDNDPFADRRTIMPELGNVPTGIEKPAPGAEQVAFVIHFAYPLDELRMLDSSLQKASDTGLRILLNRIQLLLEMRPFTLFAKNICNNRVHLRTILIPVDSAEMERMNRQNKRTKIVNRIQEAVDMAAAHNARVISLGGYTSIMTLNGKLIAQPANSKVITGNTLTAALGLRKLLDHIERFDNDGKSNVLSIVGASGNIGSIITEALIEKSPFFGKIFLVGKNRGRLENLMHNLNDKISNSTIEVDICNNLSCLKESNIIISMTNTNDPIILKHHLADSHPVLISDVSIPSAIAPEVLKMTNVTIIPFSSYVSLPQDPDFTLSSCSPPGTVVCCAGEAILCGLQTPSVSLSGNLTLKGIEIITQLAETYNFFEKTGQVKSFKATA